MKLTKMFQDVNENSGQRKLRVLTDRKAHDFKIELFNIPLQFILGSLVKS